jgi:hypothetical protein
LLEIIHHFARLGTGQEGQHDRGDGNPRRRSQDSLLQRVGKSIASTLLSGNA